MEQTMHQQEQQQPQRNQEDPSAAWSDAAFAYYQHPPSSPTPCFPPQLESRNDDEELPTATPIRISSRRRSSRHHSRQRTSSSEIRTSASSDNVVLVLDSMEAGALNVARTFVVTMSSTPPSLPSLLFHSHNNDNDNDLDLLATPTAPPPRPPSHHSPLSPSSRRAPPPRLESPKPEEPVGLCRYCIETSLCALVNVIVIMGVWAWVEPIKRLNGWHEDDVN